MSAREWLEGYDGAGIALVGEYGTPAEHIRSLLADKEALVRYVRAEAALKETKNKKVKASHLAFLSRRAHMAFNALSLELRLEIGNPNEP